MVSHRMGNGSPIAALGICAMAWTMVVATGSASAQVRSPAPGSSFEFRCNLPGTGDFVQRYTVDSVSGGIVTVSVTDHRGTHSYSKATYLNGTTMFTESRNAGVNASMSGDLEDFGPLARLAGPTSIRQRCTARSPRISGSPCFGSTPIQMASHCVAN